MERNKATDPVVNVINLHRRFGQKFALAGVDLTVKPGTVVGLLGLNGAGKTTLIKHLLGLLRAQEGTVRLFGCDPVADPVGVLSRVGYLSEDCDLPEWMRVWEFFHYNAGMYPRWEPTYAEELREAFRLRSDDKIRNLSKGQRARVGLIGALAHRPDLLILDEPSSGLDPVVRRDILGAVIRTVADEGRSVLFSSHLLNEVERAADEIVIIDQGRVMVSGPTDAVIGSHRHTTLRFSDARGTPPELPDVFAWDGAGQEWSALHADSDAFAGRASAAGAEVVKVRVPTLEELFVARVGGDQCRV